MTTPGTQTARGARDTLVRLLGLGVPYPLRDLVLDCVVWVPHGKTTHIFIRAAQGEVTYQLCTEGGKPLGQSENLKEGSMVQPSFSARLSAEQGGEAELVRGLPFAKGSLRDPLAFLRQLSPSATGVGELLRQRFRPETLAKLDAGGGLSALEDVLVDLGSILTNGELYERRAFRDVSLSPWTTKLLAMRATGDRLRRLNRFLLEDAFSLAIWRTLALPTPPITEDVTFTARASILDHDAALEVLLRDSVTVRAGSDEALPVHFSSGIADLTAVVPYGGTPSVAVDGTQRNFSYQLLSDKALPTVISKVMEGNHSTLIFAVDALLEDTGIKVKAFRTTDPTEFVFIRNSLQPAGSDPEVALHVAVEPNPAVAVRADPFLVNYDGSSCLSLVQPQGGVRYTLLKKSLAATDYLVPGSPLPGVEMFVPAEPAAEPQWPDFSGTREKSTYKIRVLVPDCGDVKEIPPGFTEVGEFQVSDEFASLTVTHLKQDTIFIVKAKKADGLCLFLTQVVVVFARPETPRSLRAVAPSVAEGKSGTVLVDDPTPGVRYRLIRDPDGVLVLNPGYHRDDLGIGTARLETDFRVELPGEPSVALPTGPLDKTTEFRVIAVKNLTAFAALPSELVTIIVSVSPSVPPPPAKSLPSAPLEIPDGD